MVRVRECHAMRKAEAREADSLVVGKGKGTDSLLESPPADPFWTSDLQNCEIINLC